MQGQPPRASLATHVPSEACQLHRRGRELLRRGVRSGVARDDCFCHHVCRGITLMTPESQMVRGARRAVRAEGGPSWVLGAGSGTLDRLHGDRRGSVPAGSDLRRDRTPGINPRSCPQGTGHCRGSDTVVGNEISAGGMLSVVGDCWSCGSMRRLVAVITPCLA